MGVKIKVYCSFSFISTRPSSTVFAFYTISFVSYGLHFLSHHIYLACFLLSTLFISSRHHAFLHHLSFQQRLHSFFTSILHIFHCLHCSSPPDNSTPSSIIFYQFNTTSPLCFVCFLRPPLHSPSITFTLACFPRYTPLPRLPSSTPSFLPFLHHFHFLCSLLSLFLHCLDFHLIAPVTT